MRGKKGGGGRQRGGIVEEGGRKPRERVRECERATNRIHPGPYWCTVSYLLHLEADGCLDLVNLLQHAIVVG